MPQLRSFGRRGAKFRVRWCPLSGTSVSWRTLRLLVASLATLVLAAAISTGPASAAHRGSSPCATVTGGRWTLGPRSGTRWQVYVTGSVSCAMGKTRVPRVTRQASSSPHGPPGWHCVKSPIWAPAPTQTAATSSLGRSNRRADVSACETNQAVTLRSTALSSQIGGTRTAWLETPRRPVGLCAAAPSFSRLSS